MSPSPPKRHRPASLDLDKNSQNDVALRIVSPGLPPLNEEMKTTVKISQKIEQQQRQLIANRNSSGNSSASASGPGVSIAGQVSRPNSSSNTSFSSTSSNSANTSAIGIPIHITVSDSGDAAASSSAASEPLDKLTTPTIAKRLKRENIPSPLNIMANNSTSPNYKPAIRSAPIRQSVPFRHQHHGRPVMLQRRGVVPFPHPQPLQQAQQTPQLQQFPIQQQQASTAATAAAAAAAAGSYYQPQIQISRQRFRPQQHQAYIHSPYRKVRVLPPYGPSGQPIYSTQTPGGSSANPRIIRPINSAQYAQQIQPQQYYVSHIPGNPQFVTAAPLSAIAPNFQQQSTPVNAKSSAGRSVTDVYHGDYTRTAPLQAQPLSSQYEYFDHQSGAPGAEDRLPVSEEEVLEMQRKYKYRDQEDGAEDDPESAAIDDEDEKNSKVFFNTRSQIFGSINLMNESVFNFKIFKSAPKQEDEEDRDETEEKDSESTKQEKDENVKVGEDKEKEQEATSGSKEVGTKQVEVVREDQEAEEAADSSIISKDDWLSQEKAKFLKICETSWDEFISTRM